MSTRKLVYAENGTTVRLNDLIQTEELGEVTLCNIRAPRKKSGSGRITVKLSDGRKVDYPPGLIGAVWVIT